MPGTYSNLTFHLAFSTKGRTPVINAMLESELYRYLAGIIHGEDGVLLKIRRPLRGNIFLHSP